MNDAAKQLLTVATFATAGFCQVLFAAAPKEYDVNLRPDTVCQLRISGRQNIVCDSRWHKLRLPCKIRGNVVLTDAEIRHFLPQNKTVVGSKWTVDEKFSRVLAERIFRALKITPADEAAYAKWTGSGPTENPVLATGEISLRLQTVRPNESGDVATIAILGTLRIVESGKMASRYGPNSWKSNWQLKLDGELIIDLSSKELRSMELTARGTITGAYSNNNSQLVEPFTAEVDLRAATPKSLSSQQVVHARAMIQLLGDRRFAERERGTDELQKLGPDVVPLLLVAHRKTKDPEVRLRLQLLLDQFSD
ncbi:MAG: hypothetical protein IH991_08250 [Planctomycetes bacterium]|nr:hypothetical protein [Planctomycetota bacterium]